MSSRPESNPPLERCPSFVTLAGVEWHCWFSSTHPHDECLSLARSREDVDVVIKWRNRT